MLHLRLIPVVVFAMTCLLAIKVAGFVIGDHRDAAAAWAVAMNTAANDEVEITGSSASAKPPEKPPEKKSQEANSPPAQPVVKFKESQAPAGLSTGAPGAASPAERALTERLQERRQELEARSRDMDLRESLMKAAEKRLEDRIEELKELEGKDSGGTARLKSLIVMYEGMRPKDAARIFDRLETKTLTDIVNYMNPRKVSEIIAQMKPEAAEQLTLELIRRKGGGDKSLPPTDLPKIEGRKPG